MPSNEELKAAHDAAWNVMPSIKSMTGTAMIHLMVGQLRPSMHDLRATEDAVVKWIKAEKDCGNLILVNGRHGGLFRDAAAAEHARSKMTGKFNGFEKDVIRTAFAPTPINNHVCPSCKNDRCSIGEKSCWKCGGAL